MPSDYLTPAQRHDLVERVLKRMESDERMKMMAAQLRAIATVAGQDTMTENVYDLCDGINRVWIESKLEQQLGEPPAEPAPPADARAPGRSSRPELCPPAVHTPAGAREPLSAKMRSGARQRGAYTRRPQGS